MNVLKFVLVLVSVNSFAADINYSKISGRYDVTYDLYPIHNEITINENRSISLKEYGTGWIMTCENNTSKLQNGKLIADLKCDRTVDQLSIMIDFNGVSDFSEFKARYFNSIYDLSDFMDFKKF